MHPKKLNRAIQQLKMAGYQHVAPELEQVWLMMLLNGQIDLEQYLAPESLGRYELAPDPLRSIKNGVICLVTVICRQVITLGVDPESSYALSDYSIYEVEECATREEVSQLVIQVVKNYAELVKSAKGSHYSFPIMRALQYVRQHIYEPCRLQEIARAVKLNPSYLSALFKREVGANLKETIRKLKLEEARRLLVEDEYSIAEIASLLGYCSSSHFAREFHKVYQCSPREFRISAAAEDVVNGSGLTVV